MTTRNLPAMIQESGKQFADLPAIRWKEKDAWKELTYRSMAEITEQLALGLMELGATRGSGVVIFSENSHRWPLADFAIFSLGGVSVPIYATNTAEQAAYIIGDSASTIVFAGGEEQYQKLLECGVLLTAIILMDESVASRSANTRKFSDVIEAGKKSSLKLPEHASIAEDDLATIIYTSGTTGNPKGVELVHGNFFHQFRAISASFTVTPRDRSLCFLPLSHVYERSWSCFVFSRGASISYVSDPKKVAEFLVDVKPTVMVSVPRLYEKIYSAVKGKLDSASALKKGLFNWAVTTGLSYQLKKRRGKFVAPWLSLSNSLADKLVLKKIREAVGGPKNFFSAGGAPLSRDIEEFFLAADLLVCQGYGLTETSPTATCNTPSAFKFGTVGKPVAECLVRIADDGEIQIKGPNVMKGYHNRSAETAEAFQDGWFRTGDVGVIDEDGYLTITDRLKDIIITSGGKNISPQNIESAIGKDHFIDQIAVIGDRRKYIAALIVPSFPALEDYAAREGIAWKTRDDLIANEEVINLYRRRIDENSGKLATFEQIKRFRLLAKEFTQDGGEITATLKLKRKVIMEKYRDSIEAMYRD